MTTTAPKTKNVSIKPETHKLLRRIATRKKWSITTTVAEAARILDENTSNEARPGNLADHPV